MFFTICKTLDFYVSVLLEVYILIKIPKIHNTYSKYNCDHKSIIITFYVNNIKHNIILFKQRILQ